LGTTNEPKLTGFDKVKDRAGVGWSFIQLLLMKAPDVVSMDPVTAVFGIAKVVLELSEVRARQGGLVSVANLEIPGDAREHGCYRSSDRFNCVSSLRCGKCDPGLEGHCPQRNAGDEFLRDVSG
jgi:hypothetical protein